MRRSALKISTQRFGPSERSRSTSSPLSLHPAPGRSWPRLSVGDSGDGYDYQTLNTRMRKNRVDLTKVVRPSLPMDPDVAFRVELSIAWLRSENHERRLG